MIDMFGHPPESIQIFRNTNNGWATWKKPRGFTMVHFLAIGSGAGGGGGATSATGGGGGGGGSSGHVRLTVPIALLPDVLYIQVPNGGAGGAIGGAGSGGGIAWVCIAPNVTATNVLITTAAVAAGGGAAGTAGGGGAGGAAATIALAASMPLGTAWGFTGLLAGQAGTAGGAAGANGGAQTIPTTGGITMGGTGGGGHAGGGTFGGDITAITGSFLSNNKPVRAGANDGGTLQLWKPFFSYPGMGGGGVAIAHKGGKGAIGSGGGGGGGGSTTGAVGGEGGEGIVIAIHW